MRKSVLEIARFVTYLSYRGNKAARLRLLVPVPEKYVAGMTEGWQESRPMPAKESCSEMRSTSTNRRLKRLAPGVLAKTLSQRCLLRRLNSYCPPTLSGTGCHRRRTQGEWSTAIWRLKTMLVSENPRVASTKWVYVKEYDSKPYPFSIALVGEWIANSVIIVPFSSFPCEKRNI